MPILGLKSNCIQGDEPMACRGHQLLISIFDVLLSVFAQVVGELSQKVTEATERVAAVEERRTQYIIFRITPLSASSIQFSTLGVDWQCSSEGPTSILLKKMTWICRILRRNVQPPRNHLLTPEVSQNPWLRQMAR